MRPNDRFGASEPLERGSSRSRLEPARRSSSQTRSITSWRYGASIRLSSVSPGPSPPPASPRSTLPAAVWSSTASTSAGSISMDSAASSLYRSIGLTIAVARRATVEMIEPEVVGEEVRDPAP